MKVISTITKTLLLILGFSSFAFSQSCPDNGGSGKAVKFNTSGKLIMKWAVGSPEAQNMYDDLDAMPVTATAITLIPDVGPALTLRKADMKDPSGTGTPEKLKSNLSGLGTGFFSGTISFTLTGGGSVGPCLYVNGVLPITLSAFNAIKKDNEVMISWETSSELNNDYVAVERSADGRKFVEIGRLLGAGTSYDVQSYHLADKAPLSGMNYYRLRQVDFDGATTLSSIVSISFNKAGKGELLVHPTVLQNGQMLNVDLGAGQDGMIQLEIYNTNGQLVSTHDAFANGKSSILISSLTSGMYIIKATGVNSNLNASFFVE